MILANESRNIQFNVQLHENEPQSLLKHQQQQAEHMVANLYLHLPVPPTVLLKNHLFPSLYFL